MCNKYNKTNIVHDMSECNNIIIYTFGFNTIKS